MLSHLLQFYVTVVALKTPSFCAAFKIPDVFTIMLYHNTEQTQPKNYVFSSIGRIRTSHVVTSGYISCIRARILSNFQGYLPTDIPSQRQSHRKCNNASQSRIKRP